MAALASVGYETAMAFGSKVSRLLSLGLLLFPCVWAGSADAHIDLNEPPMRDGNQKAGPCEGTERGTPTQFEAGSTITLSWTETIDHSGYYLISFDPDGDDFDGDGDGQMDYPASVSGGDEPSGNGDLVLLQIDDEGGNEFSAEVTLPDVACDDCTLQLIQNMGERTPLGNNPTAHLYFRCVDVVLVGGSGGGEGGSGGSATGGGGSGGMATGGMPAGGGAPGGVGNDPPLGGSGGDPMVPEPEGPPPSGQAGTGMVPGQPILPVTPLPPAGGGQPPVGAGGAGQPMTPPAPGPSTTSPAPGATPTMASVAPSASASGSATGSDGGGGDEGGCSVSPRAKDVDSSWLLLFAVAGLALGRRKSL